MSGALSRLQLHDIAIGGDAALRSVWAWQRVEMRCRISTDLLVNIFGHFELQHGHIFVAVHAHYAGRILLISHQ